jgi:hypothetical protein
MTDSASWAENAMSAAKHTREHPDASEFGGAPGPDPHAHADPPSSERGYCQEPLAGGRYMPISPAASPDDISIQSLRRGTGGTP